MLPLHQVSCSMETIFLNNVDMGRRWDEYRKHRGRFALLSFRQ